MNIHSVPSRENIITGNSSYNFHSITKGAITKMKKARKAKIYRTFRLPSFAGGLPALAITVILTASLLLFGVGGTKLALISAGLAMPEGGVEYIKANSPSVKNDTSDSSEAQASVTVKNQNAPESEEKISETEKSFDITATPSDIMAAMAEFESKHSAEKGDGKIVETKYGKDNATNTYKNICVKNTTQTKSINIEKVLSEPVDLKAVDKSQPAVLIFHTHTTEGYEMLDRGFYTNSYTGRGEDKSKNMVRVGDEIAKMLEKSGYKVIHDTEIHDRKYTGAYDHSKVNVEAYLKKYPSIQVVLDIHRDAIHLSNGNKIKPTAEINGKKAAQIMIITGAQEGKVKDFPDWEQNLRFAIKLQQTCETMYPGLMRPILFSQRKYNMNLSHCNLLLEMGSDANTLEEAAYSGRLVGSAIAKLLDEYSA